MPDADVRQAIQQGLDGALNSHALLRRLLDHDSWLAPAARDEAGRAFFLRVKDPDGHRHLFLCADRRAYDDCLARVGRAVLGEHYVTAAGVDLFASLPDEVDVVGIDAFSPPELRYSGEQVPALRRWAAAARVERALAGPRPDLSLVRRFDGYYVAMQRLAGDARALVLAPDRRGRRLAAVFTAPDAVEAFLRDQGDGGLQFEPVIEQMRGQELFVALQSLPLDGIIFNCAGPVAPRRFVPAFARAVLDAA